MGKTKRGREGEGKEKRDRHRHKDKEVQGTRQNALKRKTMKFYTRIYCPIFYHILILRASSEAVSAFFLLLALA